MIKKVTVNTLQKMRDNGEKISMLTAYDCSTARYFDEAGIDMLLVGDSLAMVILGYESTCYCGMEEMSIFTKAVARGAKRAMVVADMPFMSDINVESAVTNACNLIKCGAGAVKIEGYNDHILEVVRRCVQSGVPVISHIGFTPQSLNTLGGYTIQGKSFDATLKLLDEAKELVKAGAFAILLEMVPEECAQYITENLSVPTISCGAGRFCTGQVIVSDDMLGKFADFKPKFVRRYFDLSKVLSECAQKYNEDVKTGRFPADEEVYKLSEDELNQLNLHRGVKC